MKVEVPKIGACSVVMLSPGGAPSAGLTKKEKPKRKNSEKRKEKSRKAARERRSQESKIFDQIEEILPVPSKTLEHLDKASLVRLAINYLKIRSVVDPLGLPGVIDSFDITDDSFTNTLNGFMFVLSKDGDIIYLSDNVERYLGLTQIDLMGQSIYDYSHPCDHDDIKSFLEPLTNTFNASKYLPKPTERPQCAVKDSLGETTGPFFLRMKCTLTNKGRNLNLKSANYKVIKCTGRMIDLEMASPEHAQMIGENFRHYMIAIGESIPNPNRIETPFKTDVFMSKHSPDMKFTYVDESIEELFGYNVNDLIGTSFYQYFDVNDFTLLSNFFKTLFAKGQCDFGFYKFLVKTGGYRWISTQATVITEPNSNHPQSIILINRIVSGVENAQLITSDVQTLKGQPVNSVVIPEQTDFVQSHPVSVTASVIKAKSVVFDNKNLQVPDIKIPQPVPVLSNPVEPKGYQIPLKPIKLETNNQEQLELLAQQLYSCPSSSTEKFISSTETVLAPKTADMESGFLMFTDDNKGMTVLTDADDLTHLAPDAGDLRVPILPEMDFNDLSLFDDIFLNSTSYNLNSSNIFSEDDLFNNFANLDNDKLKLDSLENLSIEVENSTFKKFPSNENNYLAINNKNIPEMKSTGYDQHYPLSNDPFLSFTNQNDELFMSTSPTTRSDCSLADSYTSSNNSPSNSSSSNSMQFSPKSTSCDEVTNKLNLCDTTDFVEEKDLEMRAPFIPIDDDYLLNDFSYSDSNIDDLFDWISNGNSNINNNNKQSTAGGDALCQPSYDANKINKSKQANMIPHKTSGAGGCLEALLQNDELICNLKNKIYSSNQILNHEQVTQQPPLVQTQTVSQPPFPLAQSQSTLKRKNSNILIYTTLSNSGDKKIKNLVLSTDNLPNSKLADKSTVHHFVLTKNNELIPKANFVNQAYKVSKRVLPDESMADPILNNSDTFNNMNDSYLKKVKPDLDKSYSTNSVLLNLLVNGADLPNGYDLIQSYSANQSKQEMMMSGNCLPGGTLMKNHLR